ncbi:spore coat biosynthesis protein F [Leptospira gomenensis]|uniref:Spore coat biosynthesis protein F n=1 Tax=Leptospira gomenensis TaxID=2484974 RepID=A0A5F1YZM6_9LEPT|nr:spore coat biosynthesis protein F [Leptospira gomenensis]TGK36442.1 spore coat biosynthesis protein F [Leptospira gomenensis]TGK38271.1 spore coat biosynthesis protein F [Leptospira gomenensis]TGK46012.1 spore coat biosynthesis protein F [Leptospira gomenensis]TGK65276.1 spore coat biosynthesis protein F [Leptospira gomenensis]
MSGIRSTRNTPEIFAFIQARTGSTRLPGKVLAEYPDGSGKTLIDRIQERIVSVLPEERIVYLIPEEDEELREFLERRKYTHFCGHATDVRERYIRASEFFEAEWILRLTGDNPFYDTLHLDQLLEAFVYATPDLASINGLPLGMGGEIFTRRALEWAPANLEERHREHVSLHIKENPDRFRILKLAPLLSEDDKKIVPELRLTVDEPKDRETVNLILGNMETGHTFFGAEDCATAYRKHPEWFLGNSDVDQIRFRIPEEKSNERKRIGILAGDPKRFGSGHFERTRILFVLLSSEGYETIRLSQFPPDGEVDLIVVDSRDIPIPEYSKTKLFLIDHFGPERRRYRIYDALPHPDSEIPFSPDRILIPPRLKTTEPKDGSYLLCYAGNLRVSETETLDVHLERLRSSENVEKIVRVGGAEPRSPLVEHRSRISSFRFRELLSGSSGFAGYFGQSLFEAVFLKKKVSSFSIGPIHTALSELAEKNFGIPFAGELGTDRFGQTSELRRSTVTIDGSGYPRLLAEVQDCLLR